MSSKWKSEQERRTSVAYHEPIRFGVSISLPKAGRFEFEAEYRANPAVFLKSWIEGAVSSIYTGPLRNERGELTGELIVRPIIRVRNSPLIPTVIKQVLGRR